MRQLERLILWLDRATDAQWREDLKQAIAEELHALKVYEAEHYRYTATTRAVIEPVKQRLNLHGGAVG